MKGICRSALISITAMSGMASAASDADIEKLTTYATILGRGIACGADNDSASRRVAAWIDKRFPPGSNDQTNYLMMFMEGTRDAAQQQKNGNSPDSCAEVLRTFATFPWPQCPTSHPISRLNVHTRCNLGARHRWGIEGAFLVEKHQGYSQEHAFTKNFNARKGYPYLMRLAHLINTLARFSKHLANLFGELGVQVTIEFIRNTLSGPWLNLHALEQQLSQPFRLRLL